MGAHPKNRQKKTTIEPYTGELPPWPDSIGKRKKILTITGEVQYFVITDEIRHIQYDYKKKLIVFQKLQLEGKQVTEYRLGYYMIGEKPGARGRWVWGQFCLFIPAKDLKVILKEAGKRGWLSL
jgi:hypothetical protein